MRFVRHPLTSSGYHPSQDIALPAIREDIQEICHTDGLRKFEIQIIPPILPVLRVALMWWFAHLCFGLGRGPITPPDPAMVLMDRRDLNSKTKKHHTFSVPSQAIELEKNHLLRLNRVNHGKWHKFKVTASWQGWQVYASSRY